MEPNNMPTNTNPDLMPTPETDALRDRLIMTFLNGGKLDQASISNAVFDFARKLERERDQWRNSARELRGVLSDLHNHNSQTCSVYFEQDGRPTYIACDLGEAYSESVLCERASSAIAKHNKMSVDALNQQNERSGK